MLSVCQQLKAFQNSPRTDSVNVMCVCVHVCPSVISFFQTKLPHIPLQQEGKKGRKKKKQKKRLPRAQITKIHRGMHTRAHTHMHTEANARLGCLSFYTNVSLLAGKTSPNIEQLAAPFTEPDIWPAWQTLSNHLGGLMEKQQQKHMERACSNKRARSTLIKRRSFIIFRWRESNTQFAS